MPQDSRIASPGDDQRALVTALAVVARGERQGFSDLYRLTSPKLFGICLRICRSHQAAEDALNDVYLSVWRGAKSFDPERAQPMTWLSTIARNRSIDWVRSNGRLVASEHVVPDLPDLTPDAEAQVSAGQETRRLHSCLDELRLEQRDAIRTAFFDGVTYSELAERSDVPLGTMKTWIRRGLKKLRECLDGL